MEKDNNLIKITRLQTQMEQVNEKLDELDAKIEAGFADMKETMCNYVRQEEFKPVKAIAFTLIGTIFTTVIAAILALIFK